MDSPCRQAELFSEVGLGGLAPLLSRAAWEAEEVQLLPGSLSWLWAQGQARLGPS